MERARRNTHKRLATVPLPDVSAPECVRVLVTLGWLPLHWDDRECVLERGLFRIRVPLDGRLGGAGLATLLAGAAIPLFEFVEQLERIRAGGMTAYADQLRLGKSA
jgi:hypothetical protein